MGFLVSGGQIAQVERAPYPSFPSRRGVFMGEHRWLTYEEIWRRQPQLRTVTGFIARQLAQVGMSVLVKGAEGAFSPSTTHSLFRLLHRPFPGEASQWTHYRLVNTIVNQKLVYDNAYLLKVAPSPPAPIGLLPVPPRFVAPQGTDWSRPESYRIRGNLKQYEVPPEALVHIHGWNPMDGREGVSPIETLRTILAEEFSAMEYREQLWRSGARTSGVISRPVDAPEWGSPERDRFLETWASAWSGESQRAGGTPILEDGMTWEASAMTPKDAQYIESRQLTLIEVMSAYYLPTFGEETTLPSLEDRRSELFGDAMAPYAAEIEQDIEQQLLPSVDLTGYNDNSVKVFFDFSAKMRGSFSQQVSEDVAAAGGPWMSREEVRIRRGMPPEPTVGEFITPLNVTVGGLANPRDTAPTNPDNAASNGQPDLAQTTTHSPAGSPKNKARPGSYRPEPDRSIIGDALKAYYAKVGSVVRAKVGAEVKSRKSIAVPAKGVAVDSVFDRARFDPHLAKDLKAATTAVAVTAGRGILKSAGADETQYSADLVDHYMDAVAAGYAKSINDALESDLASALDQEDPTVAVVELFGSYPDRAEVFSQSTSTAMASFGAEDATEKAGFESTKTWNTGSGGKDGPRPTHAAMDGETVARGETFSNGARYPGDSSLPPEERDACDCSISFNYGG